MCVISLQQYFNWKPVINVACLKHKFILIVKLTYHRTAWNQYESVTFIDWSIWILNSIAGRCIFYLASMKWKLSLIITYRMRITKDFSFVKFCFFFSTVHSPNQLYFSVSIHFLWLLFGTNRTTIIQIYTYKYYFYYYLQTLKKFDFSSEYGITIVFNNSI